MRVRLSWRGREVACLEFGDSAGFEPEPQRPAMGGGSGHNFERDLSPLSPDDRYAGYYDGFGFGARRG